MINYEYKKPTNLDEIIKYLVVQIETNKLEKYFNEGMLTAAKSIKENYIQEQLKKMNDTEKSDNNCNIPCVSSCFSDIEIKATIVERIGIMALKNKITTEFKNGFESGFYACLDYIKHKQIN